MKKALSIILTIVLLFSVLPTGLFTITAKAQTYSGTCGKALTWTMDENGTLTISGTGDMYDYSYGSAPWFDIGITTRRIIIEEGVTSVGSHAFGATYGSVYLTVIPSTLTTIGREAFMCGSRCVVINSQSVASGAYTYDAVGYLLYNTQSVLVKEGLKYGGYVESGRPYISTETFMGNKYTLFGPRSTHSFVRSSVLGPTFLECSMCSAVVDLEEKVFTLSTDCDEPATAHLYYSGEDAILEITGEGALQSSSSYPWVSYKSLITRAIVSQGITSIPSSIFYYSENLSTVNLPESLTSIGNSAFNGCNSLQYIYYGGTVVDKENINIGSNNTQLLNATWYYNHFNHTPGAAATCTTAQICTTCGEILAEALGHDYVQTVVPPTQAQPGYTIHVCTFCEDTYVDSYTAPEGLKYSISNGEVTITDYTGSATELVIPATIEGCPVTSIGGRAFSECTSLTSITIPEGVTSMGDYAFYKCTNLASITLPESLTSIGDRAFCYCESLTSITLPESLTSIGDRAFCYCESLTSITLPEGLTSIGSYVFYNCTSLTSITIPESLTSIGDSAFCYCSSLTSITIPKGVTSIGEWAFSNCTSLSDVWYSGTVADKENINIGSYNTQLLNATWHYKHTPGAAATCTTAQICTACGEILVEALGHEAVASEVVEPTCTEAGVSVSSCTRCGEELEVVLEALGHEAGVPEVVEPTCTEAGISVSSCTRCGEELEVVLEALGHDTEGVEPVIVPSTCTVNGISTTYCAVCNEAVSVTKLPLADHTPESSIIVEPTCTEAGESVTYCDVCGEELERVVLEALDHDYVQTVVPPTQAQPGYTIHVCTFCEDTYVDSYTAPEGLKYSISNGEVTITDYTGSATELVIPATINGCPVTSIRGWAFSECTSLTSITIPEGVTSMGDYAFYNCTSLTSITLPESLTSIGDSAFCYCSSLTSITIPEGVTSIGEWAFYNCTSLSNVWYSGTVADKENINIGSYNTQLLNATWHYKHTPGAAATCTTAQICTACGEILVEALGHEAVVSEVIEPTCTEAGVSVSSCTRCGEELEVVLEALGHEAGVSEVVEPTCTEAGVSVSSCTRCGEELKVVLEALGHDYVQTVVPPTQAQPGYTIHVCTFCEDTYVDSYTAPEGLKYKISDGEVTVTDYTGSATELVIPATINGCPVTSIRGWAFSECTSLTSITIPEGVTSMGDYAFYKCTNLASITLPESLTSIGVKAFSYCSSLTSITIPKGVTSIGDGVFYNCTSLVSITIPEGVTSIGEDSFCYCESLVSITLPESLTSIGYMAFYNCTSLSDVWYSGTDAYKENINIGSYNTQLLNATWHYKHYEHTPGAVATCTTAQICTACGEILVEALGHDAGEPVVVTEPTCTEAGVSVTGCTRCGEELEVVLEALGHDTEGVEPVIEPSTCTVNGVSTICCAVCNEAVSVTELPLADHTPESSIIVEPTCTEAGESVTYCDVCGEELERVVLEALGHDTEGVEPVIVPSTCTVNGTSTICCAVCNEAVSVTELPLADHTPESSIIVEPTCTEGGYTVKICDSCGNETVCDHTDPKGHSEETRIVSIAPTCTEFGYEMEACLDCGDILLIFKVTSTGHSYVQTVVPPTQTQQGYTAHICMFCEDTYVDSYTDPIGPETTEKGDLTGDGVVSASDLNVIKRYLAGQIVLSDEQFLAGDINEDTSITAVDMNAILRMLAGLYS